MFLFSSVLSVGMLNGLVLIPICWYPHHSNRTDNYINFQFWCLFCREALLGIELSEIAVTADPSISSWVGLSLGSTDLDPYASYTTSCRLTWTRYSSDLGHCVCASKRLYGEPDCGYPSSSGIHSQLYCMTFDEELNVTIFGECPYNSLLFYQYSEKFFCRFTITAACSCTYMILCRRYNVLIQQST